MQRRQPLVAIVDDDPGVRKSLAALLNASGYRTDLYATAEEFLVTERTERPACLLLDIRLPDITGIELSRHLLANGIRLPTIFITGSGDELSRQDAKELGCVAFIDKPLTPRALLEALRTATGFEPGCEGDG
jgi:FixJ family two-component response regulator